MRSSICLTFLFAACGQTVTPGDAGTQLDFTVGRMDAPPETADLAPVTPPATYAVVNTVSSDFTTGAINTVKLADMSVKKAIDTTLSSDNDVRCFAGACYVFDHTKGVITIYDPSTWKAGAQLKTGDATVSAAKSNPHDIYPVPTTSKLYVTLFNNDAMHAVGVMDSAHPEMGVTKWIALPTAAADSDGNVEADKLHGCGGMVYVTVEDLNEKNMSTPTGNGRIFVINGSTDALDGAPIALVGQNPTDIVADGPGCDIVLLADASNQFGAIDGTGGIERVDLSQRTSKGMVIKDSALMGHPFSITRASSTLAYSILNFPDFTAKVVALDPTGGKLLGAASGVGGFIPFARVTPDGTQLYVGVNSGDPKMGQVGAGLYIGAADGKTVVTTGPAIDLGQNPYALAFY